MALIRARRTGPLDLPVDQHRFLLVGQGKAPGQNELALVDTELSTISQCIGSVVSLTCIRDQDANMAKVAQEFDKNEFVHLACHGIPDRKQPFESGFALGDGLLKVEDIVRFDLQKAQFAYLSACHTTVGVYPSCSGHAVCRVSFRDWDDVGCGRCAHKRDYI